MDQQEQQALEFMSTELTLAESRLYEHISTTFRWLMATLFAANGGAIVALLSQGNNLSGSIYSLAWFAAGLVLSIIMGALSTFAGYRGMAPITAARAAIRQALITADVAPAEEAVRALVAKQKLTWRTWVPSYAGIASLACFIAGLATAGTPILCAILRHGG